MKLPWALWNSSSGILMKIRSSARIKQKVTTDPPRSPRPDRRKGQEIEEASTGETHGNQVGRERVHAAHPGDFYLGHQNSHRHRLSRYLKEFINPITQLTRRCTGFSAPQSASTAGQKGTNGRDGVRCEHNGFLAVPVHKAAGKQADQNMRQVIAEGHQGHMAEFLVWCRSTGSMQSWSWRSPAGRDGTAEPE